MDIFTKAIPVVEPPVTGVHLIWSGPPEFLFAPGGWRIERRDFVGASKLKAECVFVTAAQLARSDEIALSLGTMIVAPGFWPGPGGGACTVCTLELKSSEGGIHGTVSGRTAFLFGMRNGKATSVAGPLTGAFDFGSTPMDQLIIYLKAGPAPAIIVSAPTLRICSYQYGSDSWEGAKPIATLQLPIREFMPALTTPPLEFAEAKRRLLPGDSIDPSRFADFMNLLRGLASSSPEPIQDTLLLRTSSTDPFDEMCALDPLRMTFSSPMWRRVLGFSFFDADPILVANRSYDYRVSGLFPGTSSTFYGFHTIPSGTALPCDFHLDDCHFRLPAPAVVQLAPSTVQTGLMVRTRRGILLRPQPTIPWIDGLLDVYSVVIDLPSPVTTVVLDLDPGHSLTIQGGDPWGTFTASIALASGPSPSVTFAQAVTQLRIIGSGFLFGVRLPGVSSGTGFQAASSMISPVVLTNTPRPAPPLSARAQSLQAGAHFQTQAQASAIPARLPLGMDVFWDPALASGVTFWPSPPPAPPPIEATSFQVERQLNAAGPWQPMIGADNLVLGSRSTAAPDTTIRPGIDLMQVYPESRGPESTSTQFTYRDTFLTAVAPEKQGTATPQPPPPGTMVQYRVRAVDAVSRPSDTWTQTDSVRLEKHEPPPLPSAPDEIPADELTSAAPTGVYATVIVKGSPSLTADQITLLGSSDNVIVLNWGWHAKQRLIDPYAKQFRVYLASPLDELPGNLTAFTADPNTPGFYKASVTLSRSVVADAGRGQYLDAGYPFFIQTHTSGTSIQVTLQTVIPLANATFRTPVVGPVTLQVKYSSQLTRAAGWAERIQPSIPITADERYQAVIRDRLNLSEEHPRDTLWVGVTAADDQPYVDDEFAGINPGGPVPGNESAVASALAQAKRQVRPDYQPPPPAAEAQRIFAPEPLNGPISFALDLTPFLAGSGLVNGQLVMHERLHAADLLAALDVQNRQIVALPVKPRPGDAAQSLTIPNPGDLAELTSLLGAGDFESIEDRLLVLLAHLHPFRDRLFQPLMHDPVSALSFNEQLPSGAARHVYRVRPANSVGQLAAEGAIPAAIVCVPSTTPGPRPIKDTPRTDDPAQSLRFLVPDHPRLKYALVFQTVVVDPGADPAAQLLRVPNRPDLYPGGNFRLRLTDGTRLTPTAVELATIEHDTAGWRILVQPESADGPVRVWVVSLTTDGAPSDLCGPSLVPFAPPPPAAPVLAAAVADTMIQFSWTWAPGAKYPMTLESSTNGGTWQRVSPPLATTASTLSVPWPGTSRQYRLTIRAASSSNVVAI
jgi:hypothetical protein